MNENDWTKSIKNLLLSVNLGKGIKVGTLLKLLYSQEITEYDLDFKPLSQNHMDFETDLLIYEQTKRAIIPRIVIEAKLELISTHDAITYSHKAQNHKNVTPFLRYGIMLGNRKRHPLPGRLFRHGSNFDFMISFEKETLSKDEKRSFVKLLKQEITYSRQFEEMLLNSRSKDRKHYSILQKKLHLE